MKLKQKIRTWLGVNWLAQNAKEVINTVINFPYYKARLEIYTKYVDEINELAKKVADHTGYRSAGERFTYAAGLGRPDDGCCATSVSNGNLNDRVAHLENQLHITKHNLDVFRSVHNDLVKDFKLLCEHLKVEVKEVPGVSVAPHRTVVKKGKRS